MNNLGLVIKREYLERVRRKSFIITTIVTPILMLALMVAPTLITLLAGPEEQTIAVQDNSTVIASELHDGDGVHFVNVGDDNTMETLKADEQYDAILIIGRDVVDNPDDVSLYTRGAPSIQTEQFITGQIEDAIETRRIERYEIDNLRQIVADIHVKSHPDTYRIDREEDEATSSLLSYILGMVMAMLLYMFIMIYGQMVMNSIIEEKNNRVLEIVVSSVRPQSLMLGKIVGIALVAVTQISIWGALLVGASAWMVPMVPVADAGGEMAVVLGQLGNAGYVATMFGLMSVFLIAGFLFYASIFAAIGSAVDNVQDATQLNSVALVPIILGILFSTVAVNDPNSVMAVWTSIIPLTSPMVMMARLPFGIPAWQVVLSLLLLVLTFFFMLWLAAKIYRVGIFMYGKKATFKDLARWVRYK